jgi:p-hydroxybenzoate 3-monooxygenase
LRTQVGIIGSGPAGLLLAQLLHRDGIDSVVIERRSAEYVLSRVRAGVLEPGTVALLDGAGVGERMRREGMVDDFVDISFEGTHYRFNIKALTGRSMMVYGQTEITRDLMAARDAAGAPALYEAEALAVTDLDSARPRIQFRRAGAVEELECDFVAGCDGFRGVSRGAIPAAALKTFDRVYPFGWLGILTHRPPANETFIYANHERGFALASMRSPEISRLYIQCAADEDPAKWSDEAIFDELEIRLCADVAARLQRGPSVEKSIAQLRSFVAEPMRHGRLFLAGDAAHIVPPTGAKGLNLACADVRDLAQALVSHYADRDDAGLDRYSAHCLSRTWRAERFSWWLTNLLHRFPEHGPFDRRLQRAEMETLASSELARAAFAECYAGLWPDPEKSATVRLVA